MKPNELSHTLDDVDDELESLFGGCLDDMSPSNQDAYARRVAKTRVTLRNLAPALIELWKAAKLVRRADMPDGMYDALRALEEVK